MLSTLKTRMAKLERQNPNSLPGMHRLTDEELDGLIAVIRQMGAGEAVDPNREAWAVAVMRRENLP